MIGHGLTIRLDACSFADSSFFFADRLLALDHHTATVYALALHAPDAASERAAEAWVAAQVEQVSAAGRRADAAEGFEPSKQQPDDRQSADAKASSCVTPCARRERSASCACAGSDDTRLVDCPETHADSASSVQARRGAQRAPNPFAGEPFTLQRGHARYLEDIKACQAALLAGDSYEICLTNEMHRQGPLDAWALYRVLRSINKAPYAAWLHFGEGQPVVCCSSPERFLRLDRGAVLEARPIKGTAARALGDAAADAAAAAALAASEKDRAENLMIVDLLRNDLGRVCALGSVHVPDMMRVESFASVHQLVSTVRGVKAANRSAVECLRASFPGGSMTGAPKIRSMEIIDALEGGPRGIYSGCLGYMSVNGTFDFNIVIRTAVVCDGVTSIGAGGAIVVQSDLQGEYDEMELKAMRLLKAVGICDGTPGMVGIDSSYGT